MNQRLIQNTIKPYWIIFYFSSNIYYCNILKCTTITSMCILSVLIWTHPTSFFCVLCCSTASSIPFVIKLFKPLTRPTTDGKRCANHDILIKKLYIDYLLPRQLGDQWFDVMWIYNRKWPISKYPNNIYIF